MTECVVDRLEAVEIEEKDGAGHVAGGCAPKRLAEQLTNPAAVRKAREHVHVGEVGQALLGLAHLGDVASDTPETLEAAGGVDDRVTRHRDPAWAP